MRHSKYRKNVHVVYLPIAVIIALAVLSFLIFDSGYVYAHPVDLQLEGQEIKGASQLTVIKGDRVFLPLRVLAEELNAQIAWNEQEKRVTLTRAGEKLHLWIGQAEYLLNDQVKTMDVQPFIYQSRALVPVRVVAEGLDLTTTWDQASQRVILTQKQNTYSADQLYWLAKIIYTEARGEPFEGQVAVGAVVLNRVKHPTFPDTIYGVIFDRQGGYVQFEPVLNGEIYRQEPDATAYEAAKRALEGEDPTGGTLFFHNPGKSQSKWMADKAVSKQIGSHVFMY